MNVHLYHGTGTLADIASIKNFDIVLTTYETACYDYFRGGVIRAIHWFRIVLDEGMLNQVGTLNLHSNNLFVIL